MTLKNNLELDIMVQDERWNAAFSGVEARVERTALQALECAGFDADGVELSVVLADDSFVQDLNKGYRGKDKPTNVLSFPQDEPSMLGDIILAYETIETEAATQGKSFEDHATHLIVHGVLHLLGHDHMKAAEAETMEGLEVEALKALGIKNPYEINDSVA